MSNSYRVMAGPTVLLNSEGLTKKDKNNYKLQAAVIIFQNVSILHQIR
jgi:hypothetical protein